ncbi:MAG: hypothetical protein FXF54_09205 [Kosmotoga sp.]|nr:MAG: hypothetical protein FXF54_09205 [Kosmotoga sp.]
MNKYFDELDYFEEGTLSCFSYSKDVDESTKLKNELDKIENEIFERTKFYDKKKAKSQIIGYVNK